MTKPMFYRKYKLEVLSCCWVRTPRKEKKMNTPDLSGSFPQSVPNLKIKPDLQNPAHGGPHFDAMQAIEGGTDQIRISPSGDVLGGTTNIGKAKLDW